MIESKKTNLFAVVGLLLAAPSYAATSGTAESSNLSNLSVSDIETFQEGEISTLSTIGGGLVGTGFGLGLGHLVIGKYGEMGWVFTVGEIASAAAMSMGAAQLATGVFYGDDGGADLLWIGMASYVGFRIWEIIDVWTRPGRHNRRYRAIQAKVSDEEENEENEYEEDENDQPNVSILPLITPQKSFAMGIGFRF